MNDSYDDIDYVFVRGGSIIPTQEPHDNTELMKTKDFLLIVALDNQTSFAKGSLYWDSGDSLNPDKTGHYNFYNFDAVNVSI